MYARTTQLSDADLLRGFVRDHSQEAFATLVDRHLEMVFRVALREDGPAQENHWPKMLPRAVFLVLAEKIADAVEGTFALRDGCIMWPRQAYAAIDARRKEQRASNEHERACAAVENGRRLQTRRKRRRGILKTPSMWRLGGAGLHADREALVPSLLSGALHAGASNRHCPGHHRRSRPQARPAVHWSGWKPPALPWGRGHDGRGRPGVFHGRPGDRRARWAWLAASPSTSQSLAAPARVGRRFSQFRTLSGQRSVKHDAWTTNQTESGRGPQVITQRWPLAWHGLSNPTSPPRAMPEHLALSSKPASDAVPSPAEDLTIAAPTVSAASSVKTGVTSGTESPDSVAGTGTFRFVAPGDATKTTDGSVAWQAAGGAAPGVPMVPGAQVKTGYVVVFTREIGTGGDDAKMYEDQGAAPADPSARQVWIKAISSTPETMRPKRMPVAV